MRAAGQARLAVRRSWRAAAWGFAGGLLLQALLPLSDLWLPVVAAATVMAFALAFFLAGGLLARRRVEPGPPEGAHGAALLEHLGTWEQFGHAFTSAAAALAALAAGLWVGHAAGL